MPLCPCTKHKDNYAYSLKPSFLSRLRSPSQDGMESQENFKVAEGRESKEKARTDVTSLPSEPKETRFACDDTNRALPYSLIYATARDCK